MELSRVQRWMQAFIIDAQAEGAREVENLIAVPKTRPTAIERLNLYRDGYWHRMEEVLADDYPALQRFLGAGPFSRLVRCYITAVPPRGPMLHGLGDGLPEFIDSIDPFPRRAAAGDVARVERAGAQVLTVAPAPVLSTADLRAIPEHVLERARLTPVAALTLVSCRYPAARFVRATFARRTVPPMRQKKTWTVIYRRDDVARSLDLSFAAYQLLGSLVAGEMLGVAVEASLARHSRSKSAVSRSLFGWFRDWTAAGFFQRIEVVEP